MTNTGFSSHTLVRLCSSRRARVQIQITKKNDTVPITRDYIGKCEKALAMHEMAHGTLAKPAPKTRRSRKISERD